MGYVLDSRPTGALFRVGGTLTVALVLTTDFTYGVLRSIEINDIPLCTSKHNLSIYTYTSTEYY